MKLKKILLLSAALIPMVAYGSSSWAGTDHDGVREIIFGNDTAKETMQPHVKMMPQREQPPVSRASREIIHDAMKKAIEKDQKTIDAILKTEKEAHDIFVAPKFDKKAYLKKTAKIRKLRDTLMKSKTETLAAIAEKIPAEDRQFIDRLHPMMGHKMKMHGRHDMRPFDGKDHPRPMMGAPDGGMPSRPMMGAPNGGMPPCPMMNAPDGAKPMPPMDMEDDDASSSSEE